MSVFAGTLSKLFMMSRKSVTNKHSSKLSSNSDSMETEMEHSSNSSITSSNSNHSMSSSNHQRHVSSPIHESSSHGTPDNVKLEAVTETETGICGWCQKQGLKLFTLRNDDGTTKAYCSELCFTHSRRASYKKTKICHWCKHTRHTVNYVDFHDGHDLLKFCSNKCLNQYKMNIIGREIDMIPKHLLPPFAAVAGLTAPVSASNSGGSIEQGNGSSSPLESISTTIKQGREHQPVDLCVKKIKDGLQAKGSSVSKKRLYNISRGHSLKRSLQEERHSTKQIKYSNGSSSIDGIANRLKTKQRKLFDTDSRQVVNNISSHHQAFMEVLRRHQHQMELVNLHNMQQEQQHNRRNINNKRPDVPPVVQMAHLPELIPEMIMRQLGQQYPSVMNNLLSQHQLSLFSRSSVPGSLPSSSSSRIAPSQEIISGGFLPPLPASTTLSSASCSAHSLGRPPPSSSSSIPHLDSLLATTGPSSSRILHYNHHHPPSSSPPSRSHHYPSPPLPSHSSTLLLSASSLTSPLSSNSTSPPAGEVSEGGAEKEEDEEEEEEEEIKGESNQEQGEKEEDRKKEEEEQNGEPKEITEPVDKKSKKEMTEGCVRETQDLLLPRGFNEIPLNLHSESQKDGKNSKRNLCHQQRESKKKKKEGVGVSSSNLTFSPDETTPDNIIIDSHSKAGIMLSTHFSSEGGRRKHVKQVTPSTSSSSCSSLQDSLYPSLFSSSFCPLTHSLSHQREHRRQSTPRVEDDAPPDFSSNKDSTVNSAVSLQLPLIIPLPFPVPIPLFLPNERLLGQIEQLTSLLKSQLSENIKGVDTPSQNEEPNQDHHEISNSVSKETNNNSINHKNEGQTTVPDMN